MSTPKTTAYTEVWHYGNLAAPRRRAASSYEFWHLSVSVCPLEWRRIARLGGAALYSLRRRDGQPGRFVDMLALSPRARARYLVALPAYVRRATVWRAWGYDSETETPYYSEHTTREAARRESRKVTSVAGWTATPALRALWRQMFTDDIPVTHVEECALALLFETQGYDGLWWHEQLDGHFSAPRGCIFQRALPQWQPRVRAEHEAPTCDDAGWGAAAW